MRILRIKQAECALADGRLDEACELAGNGDLRSHRRGQQLVGRLLVALAERAGEHLAAGQTRQALADCEKAEALGGNLPELASLRSQIAEAVASGRLSRRRRADALAEARGHIDAGRLTLAAGALAGAGDDSTAADMRRNAAARRAEASAAMDDAAAAADRRDWPAAVDAIVRARGQRCPGGELAELRARVIEGAGEQAKQDFIRGRLDLAAALLDRLAPIAAGHPQPDGLAHVLAQCRRAWQYIRSGRAERAREALRLVEAMHPGAKWVARAIEDAGKAAEAVESLRAGPLATVPPCRGDGTGQPAGGPAGLDDTLAMAGIDSQPAGEAPSRQSPPAGAQMPPRCQMQVDGAGSFLILTPPTVTVGPVSSPAAPDLGLMAEATLPVVTITRADDDYMLEAPSPVQVNDKATSRKLLADGDRIALSPRCRMRFRLPNAASTTAILELSGTRLPQTDARRVILLDREIILGPGPSAHVRADLLDREAVLYLRDGRLMLRADSPMTIDRRPADPDGGVPLGAPVGIGPIGLVVTEA